MTDLNVDPSGSGRPQTVRSLVSRIKLGHVVMVLAGLFALVFNLAVLRSDEATIEVVLAASDIRAGTTITAGHLQTTAVPADDVLSVRFVAASEMGAVLGKLAVRSIEEGEPILGDDLLALENRRGLRAMSVPIEESRAVAGGLARGDSVDVVLVESGVATFIATGLEVLDIPDVGTNALGARSGYAPTLAVDAAQALRIAAALDVGEVHIIRSTGAAVPDLDSASAGAVEVAGDQG